MNLDIPTKIVTVTTPDGVTLSVTVAGEGPLVVLVHGFPESWYSWRHQFGPLTASGYRVAALHVRGYGASDKPSAIEAYAIARHAGDIAAVIRALSPSGAVVIGHDWGAMQVQAAALLYPDLVHAIASLSVPATFPPPVRPTEVWRKTYTRHLFYQAYFQEPGPAEAEFEADIQRFLRLFFVSLSADGERDNSALLRPMGAKTLLDGLPDPAELPSWLSPEDMAFYVAEFEANGLRGPLNRYRNADLDWEQMAAFAGRSIEVPALFVGGALDPTRWYIPGSDRYADPAPRFSDPRGLHVIPGVGHWIQQEALGAVNRHLLGFLAEVAPAGV